MEETRGRKLGAGRVDLAKVDATTAEDTQRHMAEDGLDPGNPLAGFTPASKVAEVRKGAAMSQDAFARALHVPVKTIRNWEQGRSRPDPAARALLAIVADDPARAFEAIGRRLVPISAYASGEAGQYPKGIVQDGAQGAEAMKDAVRAAVDAVGRDLDAALKRL